MMAMHAEVLNQSLDDDKYQRPRTPFHKLLLLVLQSMILTLGIAAL